MSEEFTNYTTVARGLHLTIGYRLQFAAFVCPLLFGLVLAAFARKLHLHGQVVAMVAGALIGAAHAYAPYFIDLRPFFWPPDNIITACHPIMIVKVATGLDTYVFMKSISQVVILAIVGTSLFTLAFGFLLIVVTGRELNFVNIVAAGTTLAAIDVPDILMELNRIKNLEVVMDGESIFGNAFCVVTFTLCLGVYSGCVTKWYHVFCLYIRFYVLAIITGYVIGKISAIIIKSCYGDYYNAIATILSSSYFCYFICEDFICCSGSIATFINGFIITQERNRLSTEVDVQVQRFISISYNAVELLNCVVLSAYVFFRMAEIYKGFDFPVAFGVYILGNVIRLLILVMLTPILSRLGYGFDVTSMITSFWASKRGSMQILQVIYIAHYEIIDILGTELLCFTLVYLALTFLINMTSLKYILKKFGLIEFTMARKNNISQCFNIILKKRQKNIFALKTNRFFSDANWPLINEVTKLKSPYMISDRDEIDPVLLGDIEAFCPNCFQKIPYIPTKKEINDMIREVKTLVLNAQRVSFVKQYEMGLLRKSETESLLQCVEVALMAPDLRINLDNLLNLFETNKFYSKLKSIFENWMPERIYVIPERKIGYWCYILVTSAWWIYVKCFIVTLHLCLIISFIICLNNGNPAQTSLKYSIIGTTGVFAIEVVMKIGAYSHLSIIKGIQDYFKYFWNICDVVMLLIDIVSLITYYKYELYYMSYLELLRVFCLIRLFSILCPLLVRYCEELMDKSKKYAFTVGIALIYSYEEVLSNFHVLCRMEIVKNLVTSHLHEDKLRVTMSLVQVEMDRPQIKITLSTNFLKFAILKSMRYNLNTIKTCGYVDEYEFKVLNDVIDDNYKLINPSALLPSNLPKDMFKEIPWISGDRDLQEFLYPQLMIRIWNPGDIICRSGDYIGGIIILIKGLLKMTYVPDANTLHRMEELGELPVKEIMTSVDFSEEQVEYILAGSSVGEFSLLTGRRFCCSIEAVMNSCGFVIGREVMYEALMMNADPLMGLESRLWRFVSFHIMLDTLNKSPVYTDVKTYPKYEILNRIVIPRTSHYKVFHINPYMDNIYLFEGQIVDQSTREIYTAPCMLPRSVRHIMMPRCSELNISDAVEVKLIIIPHPHTDFYEMMDYAELRSVFVKDIPPNCMVRDVKRRLKRKDSVLFFGMYSSRSFIKNKRSKSFMSRSVVKQSLFSNGGTASLALSR